MCCRRLPEPAKSICVIHLVGPVGSDDVFTFLLFPLFSRVVLLFSYPFAARLRSLQQERRKEVLNQKKAEYREQRRHEIESAKEEQQQAINRKVCAWWCVSV